MPCYTRFSVTTTFEGGDVDALIAALQEVNLRGHSRADLRRHAENIIAQGYVKIVGRIAENDPEVLDRLKRSYAEKVIEKQAKARGYRVRKNTRTGRMELSR